MRKLLLFFAMLCVSIGAWAQTYVENTDFTVSYDTWYGTDIVARVKVITPGALATALTEIDASKNCKVVNVNVDVENTTSEKNYLNEADIRALSTINAETIDLQDAVYTANKVAFTFRNANVKNLILPDNWTKDQVNTCALEVAATSGSVLGSAISQCPNGENAALIAYVNRGNTLRDAIQHIFSDQHNNSKLCGNGGNMHNNHLSNLKFVTISGYPHARDFGQSGGVSNWDENGHIVFDTDAEPDEMSTTSHAVVNSTEIRKPNGSVTQGALDGCGALKELDLESAIIPETYNNDLILSLSNVIGASTTKVVIPTSPLVETLPADFLAGYHAIEEICIPSNIKNIKTRAFARQTNGFHHIWTTKASGDDASTIVDNGVYDTDGGFHNNSDYIPAGKTIAYGTYTFSSNLKLIESNAFSSPGPKVKDVYVLALEAPECHVDAFTTKMYAGNNGFEPSIVDGIITRDSYTNGTNSWITMLHYPREAVTPNTQRYTDQTRDYSIATNMKDGRGGTIYFPNLGEFVRAYAQGTTGFLWNAWDPERDGDLAFTHQNQIHGTSVWTASNQSLANKQYNENTSSVDKTTSVFYETSWPGVTIPVDATAKPYYENTWKEWYESEYHQLYPQIATTGTGVYVDQPVYDANGNLEYVEADPRSEGTHVQQINNEYVANSTGTFIKNYTITANDNGAKVLDYEYEIAENGKYYKGVEYVQTNWGTEGSYYQKESYEPADDGEYLNAGTDTNPYWILYTTAQTWGNFEQIKNNPRANKVIKWVPWTAGTCNVTCYLPVDKYMEWTESDGDVTRYDKKYTGEFRDYNSTTDIDDARYDVTLGEGYRTASTEAPEKYLQHYAEEEVTSYVAATDEQKADATVTLYKVKTERVEQVNVTKENDYRGWHQFVLVATATNSSDKFKPIRSYITDNNWWTICLPYDLKKSEVHLLYGGGDETKTPLQVCRLMSVTRDIDNERITLNFSKNLMKYKWDAESNKVLDEYTESDPVVIYKGVPYLIRPNLKVDADKNITGKRRFDIYESATSETGDIETEVIQNKELYDKLMNVASLTGSQMNQIIYDGEYTVPALVVNDSQNKDKATESVTVNGKTYKKHPTLTYTFVGSFFKSVLPQYCYFLGWNSKKQQAAFYYNKVSPENAKTWAWINETAIIMPGFDTATEITAATDLENPARWVITSLTDDSYESTVHAKATSMVMDFGNIESDATGISELDIEKFENKNGRIYSVNGQFIGTDAGNLAPGLYIRNGKKFVVKP